MAIGRQAGDGSKTVGGAPQKNPVGDFTMVEEYDLRVTIEINQRIYRLVFSLDPIIGWFPQVDKIRLI